MRFAQMPLRMRKSQCFPSLMTFPFSPTSRSQQAKGGRGGEWIHLVLLGMANRCQMGINGPPNVLLQKAFFSAQYFAYILSNTYIINLQKEYSEEKSYLWIRKSDFGGLILTPLSLGVWLVCIFSKWDWQLAQPKLKCEHIGMPFDKSCRKNFPRFSHFCRF